MPAERKRAKENALRAITMSDDVVSVIPGRIVSMFAAHCDNLISSFGCGAIALLNHVCQKGARAQIGCPLTSNVANSRG